MKDQVRNIVCVIGIVLCVLLVRYDYESKKDKILNDPNWPFIVTGQISCFESDITKKKYPLFTSEDGQKYALSFDDT